MKKIIIMLPILFLVTNFTYAQINCGTEPSAEYLQELDNSLSSLPGCQDPSDYDLSIPITFNLVLYYAKFGTGIGEFNQVHFDEVETDINDVYNEHNIFFNYSWIDLDCDDCLENYDNWPVLSTLATCIQGNVVSIHTTTPSGVGGVANVNKGTFWANIPSVPHELGHAIGLVHTHRNDPTPTGYTDELVTRSIPTNENDPCSCNCLQTGDRICDTPPDPNIPNASTQAEWDHNNAMFNYDDCVFENNLNIADNCGSVFEDPNQLIMNNVMSYHCDELEGQPRLTDGQNERIRFKRDLGLGDGTFEWQHDPNEPDFTQGLNVNVPTIKNTDEAFNGDIVVNSDLTIENCVIELTEGHKIIVNSGANLTITNAKIRTYTGSICYFPMVGKEEWEGIEIVPSVSNLTSVSVYSGSTIDVSESGIYNEDGSGGLLNLSFNNSTLNGPALTLSNTIGVQKLLKSNFNHTVAVTDNFYLSVEGCSFDFIDDNTASGIKAYDTHLAVRASYDGVRTSFKNCGNGVEFISTSAQSCKISKADFIDVLSGINAESVAGFFDAHGCTISMRDPMGNQGFGNGILLNNFIDFEIYDNIPITGSDDISHVGIKLIGVGVNDNPNLVINNTIKDCQTGIETGSIALGNSMSGIEFECNTMINIQKDNFHTHKIGPHQGRGGDDFNFTEWRPSGNKFDGVTDCENNPQYCFTDFNYEGGGFILATTYHYRDQGLENIEWYNDGSQNTGIEIFAINELIDGEVPQCTYPPLPSDPNPLPQVNTTRSNLLDGGDTDGSINIIVTDSDNDPNSVITTIIGNSPWVSIPVVQTLFNYSSYYTENQVADVIIQNPAVLDDNYIYAIAFESGTFSVNNQQLMIQAYQNGDVRMDYEGSLVDLILEGTLHIKNSIQNEIDNETFNQSIIRTAVADKISYTKLYQTVETYLLDQDYQGALLALNAKYEFENFDPHLLLEKTTYAEIIQMEVDLFTLGESWSNLSIANQNRLLDIANNYNGVATIKSRNILKMYFDIQFGALPVEPVYSPLQFVPSIPRSIVNEDISIKVFPNPAYDVLNVILNDKIEMSTFRLFSIEGKLVKSKTLSRPKNIIDLSGVNKGIYFYELTQDGKTLSSNKIIILD